MNKDKIIEDGLNKRPYLIWLEDKEFMEEIIENKPEYGII